MGADIGCQAGVGGAANMLEQPDQRGHQGGEPGQRAQARRSGVCQRHQPPRTAPVGQQGAPQPHQKRGKHAEAHGFLAEVERGQRQIGLPVQRPVHGLGRQPHHQHMGHHRGHRQHGAAQTPRRQGAGGALHQPAFDPPDAQHRHQQGRRQHGPQPGGGAYCGGSVELRLDAVCQGGQPPHVGRPGRSQIAPEINTQRGVGALGELLGETGAALGHQVFGELLGVDGHQAGQLEVVVQRVALFLQGGALLHDVHHLGARAFFGGGAQLGQPVVQLGELAFAVGHQQLGLGADGVHRGQRLADVAVFCGLGRDGGKLLAQRAGGRGCIRCCRGLGEGPAAEQGGQQQGQKAGG